MNIVSMKDVYLISCDDDRDAAAYHMKKYMSNNNVTFTHLHLEKNQRQDNLDNFSIRLINDNNLLIEDELVEEQLTATPFIIYTAVCDDQREISRSIRSVEQLLNSNIVSLQN